MQTTQVKIEVEKCNRKRDFGMWKFKILMQLENSGLDSVLNKDDIISSSKKEKDVVTDIKPGTTSRVLLRKEKHKRAKNMICASLSNLVSTKVIKQINALGVWKALEGVWKALEKDYQTKTLPNIIYLK